MVKNYEQEYENKKFIEKTDYFFQTIYNTGKFYSKIVPNLFVEPDKQVAKVIYPNKNNKYDKIDWINTSNSLGLIVSIHGLLGSPKTLGYEIAKKVSLYNKNNKLDHSYDVLLPIIPFRGNCALDVASSPLYEIILDYVITNPTKPIHLIGCSNGCRIASWIECKLRNNPNNIPTNIKLTCIVGAFGGSILVDKFNWILGTILDDNVISDLSTKIENKSETNTKLVKKINSELIVGSRFYEFYGTANDWLIPNFNDCFPIITNDGDNGDNGDNKNFKVIYHDLKYGYDHVGLGWFLADEIFNNSIEWMNKF